MLLAIQSQPPGSVQGSLRITEQGEMIQTKFGVPQVAQRQLEIYHTAVLLATLQPPKPAKAAAWRDLMDRMAAHSCAAYRGAATPQEELGNLNIGSRPTRWAQVDDGRGVAAGDSLDLRMDPGTRLGDIGGLWARARASTRLVLPAWLGVADAIALAVEEGQGGVLRDMYEHWPFFTSVIDLIEMVLAKADMRIASLYDAVLVTKPEVGSPSPACVPAGAAAAREATCAPPTPPTHPPPSPSGTVL
eukprot:scaffold10.g2436.t1